MHAREAIVSAAQLSSQLRERPASRVVIDTRFSLAQPDLGRQEYLAGHIPGALYAHLDEDLAALPGPHDGRHPLPDPARFAARLGSWGIDRATQVVVYDHASGAIAARLWWLMRWLGHTRVSVLDGGYAAWQAGAYATEQGEVPIGKSTAREFAATPDPDMVIALGPLRTALADGEVVLLDARAPQRFAGEVEPIDPVAGHIPGATNYPFERNLGQDGRWLTTAQLAERYRLLLGSTPAHRCVAMCGSGVTACHLLLALEVAGLPGARLYPGSWSEWIRDPARPVGLGERP